MRGKKKRRGIKGKGESEELGKRLEEKVGKWKFDKVNGRKMLVKKKQSRRPKARKNRNKVQRER